MWSTLLPYENTIQQELEPSLKKESKDGQQNRAMAGENLGPCVFAQCAAGLVSAVFQEHLEGASSYSAQTWTQQ